MTTKALDKQKVEACTNAVTYTVRPKARIYETEDAYMVDLEMPGISESGADITAHKHELKIVGTSDDLDVRYERRFRMPETVDMDNITASMQFGILKLVLPKVEEVKPKTIKVLAG